MANVEGGACWIIDPSPIPKSVLLLLCWRAACPLADITGTSNVNATGASFSIEEKRPVGVAEFELLRRDARGMLRWDGPLARGALKETDRLHQNTALCGDCCGVYESPLFFFENRQFGA